MRILNGINLKYTIELIILLDAANLYNCKVNTAQAHIDTVLVVIVLYQMKLSDSKSYQSLCSGFRKSLLSNQRVDLVVVNNGPDTVSEGVNDEVFRLHLIEQLDNPGVSKAYNVAGHWAQRLGKKWMLILDQDTDMTTDFWPYYALSIESHPDLPVHAPKLYDGSVLASPCGYRFYRGYVLTKIKAGKTPMTGRNVLNSGLLINVDSFWKVNGYDENVNLYFSDFVFFDRLKKFCTHFAVVPVELAHNLSSSDYSDKGRAMYRFSLYCEGALAASKGHFLKTFLYVVTVGGRSLMMNKRFNTLCFSSIFYKVWLTDR